MYELITKVFAPALEIAERLRPVRLLDDSDESEAFGNFDHQLQKCWRQIGETVRQVDPADFKGDLRECLEFFISLRRDTEARCNSFGDVALFIGSRLDQLERAARRGWSAAKLRGEVPAAETTPDPKVAGLVTIIDKLLEFAHQYHSQPLSNDLLSNWRRWTRNSWQSAT